MTMGAVPYSTNTNAESMGESQAELIIWDTPGLGTNQCFEDMKTIQNVQCIILCY